MAMLAVAAIADLQQVYCITTQYGRTRAVNKQRYGWHMVVHQPKTCVCLPYHMVTILVNVYNRSVGGIRCFRDLQTLANYAKKAEMK